MQRGERPPGGGLSVTRGCKVVSRIALVNITLELLLFGPSAARWPARAVALSARFSFFSVIFLRYKQWDALGRSCKRAAAAGAITKPAAAAAAAALGHQMAQCVIVNSRILLFRNEFQQRRRMGKRFVFYVFAGRPDVGPFLRSRRRPLSLPTSDSSVLMRFPTFLFFFRFFFHLPD